MVRLVVSHITQQFGHSVTCASRRLRKSASTVSSRYSFSSCRNSLQVSKDVVPFPLEETRQLLAQLQPSPQQPALNRRYRNPQRFSRLFRTQFFDVSQNENGSKSWP